VFKNAELEPLLAAARRGRRDFATAFGEANKANPRLGAVAPVVLYRTLGASRLLIWRFAPPQSRSRRMAFIRGRR
jgi:hypothetical protein